MKDNRALKTDKEELLRHLADGRKVDAILHYRNASNEDLAVAKGVVEQLIRQTQVRDATK